MNDYAQRICVFCAFHNCAHCIGRFGDRWCECACFFLNIQGDDE